MSKRNEQNSLDKRLKVYAAAAAGTLALAPPANALIHYSGPQYITVDWNNPSVPISLDGNPGGAFKFAYGTSVSHSTSSFSYHDVVFGPYAAGAGVFLKGLPANIPYGDLIPGNPPLPVSYNPVMRVLNSSGTTGGSPVHMNRFPYPPKGYLGVTFKLPNNQRAYGWIEYEGKLGQVEKPAASGIIKGWAYEDSGGAIRAGQKQSPSVPTFTEWGLYLFAAILILGGILKIRAKEEVS
jgi:hypothetical protein